MKRRFRLKKSGDIKRVRCLGKSYAHPLLVLITAKSDSLNCRVAIVVGRHYGNAVQRNRVKRRVRACLSQILPMLTTKQDLVFLIRKPIKRAEFQEICTAIQQLLMRAGLSARNSG